MFLPGEEHSRYVKKRFAGPSRQPQSAALFINGWIAGADCIELRTHKVQDEHDVKVLKYPCLKQKEIKRRFNEEFFPRNRVSLCAK